MFFDYSLLNRRNGKFSLIWLVANDRLEYRRRTDKNFRDVMTLDVPKVCEDIIRYICAQMPTPGSGRSRPRFSLYLSSMLMAGSVRVYKHQTGFLLSDVGAAFEKLMKTTFTGCLENEPVNFRKVTLTVDPLEMVPTGDPFQLGALYDLSTMLDVSAPPAEPEQEGGAGQDRREQQHPPAELNPNVARPSDITLREEDRTARLQHLFEDFGDPLLPHQRSLQHPMLDPLLELELELLPPPPPPPPGEPGRLPPPPPTLTPPWQPAVAAAGQREGEDRRPGSVKASEPAQHVLLDAAARAAEPMPAGGAHLGVGDGVRLLGEQEAPAVELTGPPCRDEQPPSEKQPAGEMPPAAAEMPPPAPGAGEVPTPAGEMPPPPPPPAGPPPGETTLTGAEEAPGALQAEVQVTPQRGQEPLRPAERPTRRRTPRVADVTMEEPPPPPPAGHPDSQRESEVSSSLRLPQDVPAPPVRLGRCRRLAVDATIQLDREAVRRRMQDGSYDTQRAASSTEDNAVPPSERLMPALELLRGTGRPMAPQLRGLHDRHCVTRHEQDWSWHAGRQEEEQQPQPEPEVQRDRTLTATVSGTGSLLSASDLPSARSSAGQQLSFVVPPTAADNLPIITEAQERTPGSVTGPPLAAEPPPSPPPPPAEEQPTQEQLLLPPVEEQLLVPPVDPQLLLPPVEEPPPPPPAQEEAGPAAAPVEPGAPGAGGSARTLSSEEGPPTTSSILSGSSQFRSASRVPEDLSDRIRSSPAGWLSFCDLAPVGGSTRLQAAATFAHLLRLHAQKQVFLQQVEAYRDILIYPPM